MSTATTTGHSRRPGVIRALPDILGSNQDYSKEIGVVAIAVWFHATARITERVKSLKSIPPVLLSTVTALVGLNIINGIAGQNTLNKMLKYFDPSVDFLGNW